MPDTRHSSLLELIIQGFAKKGWSLAFAESCTGGRLSADLTTVPGSSDVVAGSAVCYQLQAKRKVLGIDYVNENNVVSQYIAQDMAVAARKLYGAHVGVGTTGYLDGDSPEAYWSIVYENAGEVPFLWKHVTFSAYAPRSLNREILVEKVMHALADLVRRTE